MSVFKNHVSRKPFSKLSTKSRRSTAFQRAIESLESRQMLSGTLLVTNPDALPGSNRVIFNYVQNPDTTVPNVVHNTQTLTISDTGSTALTINSMTTNGPFALANASSYTGMVIQAGGSITVTLSFTQRSLPAHSYNETNYTTDPNGGAAVTGSLNINSSDASQPSKIIPLAGYWQDLSNSNTEPSLQTVVNLVAGYQTVINSSPIPDLTETNGVQLYGSEVASTSWEPANPTQPVSMVQLGSFRTEGNNASVYWYTASAQQSHLLFTDAANQGQTLLPTLPNGNLAQTTFTPTGAFGIRIDNEYSTDSINVGAGNTGGGGHHIRFFPLVDSSGNTIPNTYIVALDYGVLQTENFDFNDNMLIVSNIRPSGTPETPIGLTAVGGSHPVLSWTADSYSPVAYNVYSSSTLNGTYTKLTTTPITTNTFTDTSNTGTPVYYKVTAIDTTQTPAAESFPATVTANVGPVTLPYAFTTYKGVGFTFNPLVSDSDLTGTLLPSSVQVSATNHGGTLSVDSTSGLVTYTPAASFVGTETFTYTVADSNGTRSAATTVTVNVLAAPAVAPVANNYVVTDLANSPVQINELSVDLPTTTFNLASVLITTQPTKGTVTVNSDGSVNYTPNTNFVGGDEFRYTVADNNGATSNIGIVDINVGTEISSARGASHVLTYTDQDGTPVTVSLNRGIADVYFDGSATVATAKGRTTVTNGSGLFVRQVTLSGTTVGSSLRMTGARKGQFTVAGITDASPLGSIAASGANLTNGSGTASSSSLHTGTLLPLVAQVAQATPTAGTINLAGVRSINLNSTNLATIVLGNTGVPNTSFVMAGTATDTQLSSSVAINVLKAKAWVKSKTNVVQINVPSINNLQILGEFDSSLTLDSIGRTPALNNAHIGGPLAVSNWNITGNVRTIYAGSVNSSFGGIAMSGLLNTFVVASGGLTSDISAGVIGNIRIAGTLASNIASAGSIGSVTASQLVGGLIEAGTTDLDAASATLATIGASKIGTVHLTSKLANTFSDSNILANVIGNVIAGPINTAGTDEGIAGHILHAITVTTATKTARIPGSALLSPTDLSTYLSTKAITLGNFDIDIL